MHKKLIFLYIKVKRVQNYRFFVHIGRRNKCIIYFCQKTKKEMDWTDKCDEWELAE